MRASLNHAEEGAAEGAHAAADGRHPADAQRALLDGSVLSANPRYALLNEQIFAARGEDLHLAIDGVERLSVYADTIAPEAACTSVQLHQLVDPAPFATHWNAAQCIAGIQLAVGANSPFFFGRELWRETRIALFEQATDTRPEELKAQGVRPRVWFGERWITSIFDLFEENVRYFPALLPVCEDEDPVEVLDRGDTPRLQELRLHNGTIYRWNRPIYDVVRGRPHLRVENRVLPAGPTVVDTLANAALYYGLVRVLADDDRPVWTQMSFSAAEENFHAGARDGIDARVYWPGVGEVPAAELVLRRLLPMAHEGLERWGVDAADRDRLLGIIERRCVEGRNGATWQAEHVPPPLRAARPRRRAARDDGALPRAHALQRAGAHLAARLTAAAPRAAAGRPAAMRSAAGAGPRRARGRGRRRRARGPVGDRLAARRPRAGHRAARPHPAARRRRGREVAGQRAGRGRADGPRARPGVRGQPFVYLYFTTAEGLKLERWRYEDDRLTREASRSSASIEAGPIHDSGRIAFGPDRALYVATGDAGDGDLAQDPARSTASTCG